MLINYLAGRGRPCSGLDCGEEERTLPSLTSFVFTFHCTMKPPHISQVTWLEGGGFVPASLAVKREARSSLPPSIACALLLPMDLHLL